MFKKYTVILKCCTKCPFKRVYRHLDKEIYRCEKVILPSGDYKITIPDIHAFLENEEYWITESWFPDWCPLPNGE